ncbi:MAG: hypothetical protein LBL16_00140 [Endomicrobium sp.]|nr:hypothetical protein [Endomicrobium sp.]
MSTKRLVKWSKESKEFFEKAEDNSLVLDLVISYSCISQSGEGFEELVNTINSEEIKRKVKKVVITDTSYLYRHDIPEFSKYSDINIPTEWYLTNKKVIEKLESPKEVKSWVEGLKNDGFNDWYIKIKEDFVKDSNFKNSVIEMACSVLSRLNNSGDIGRNIDFILEETAYTCLNFKNVNMVYPMSIVGPVQIAIEKYKLNVTHLAYNISWHAIEYRPFSLDRDKIDNQIAKFMKEDSSNVNFFVISKHGGINI